MSLNGVITAVKTAKNFCCTKDEGAVDYSTRWFKKFYSGGKNLDDQTRSGRPKIVDSKAVLKAREANLVSSTWRVSGEFDISPSSVHHYLHDLGQSIQSCQIVPHVTKILQNFWLTQVHENCIASIFEVKKVCLPWKSAYHLLATFSLANT